MTTTKHPAKRKKTQLAAKKPTPSSGGDDKLVPTERKIFGRNLSQARREAGLTQAEVQKRTGLTQPYISAVENGKAQIATDNAARLAKAVGKPLWELFKP
jgi:DNA-binding XRE family transcriptional regulator